MYDARSLVESPFAALRLRTDAAKLCKRVERATAVIPKMLMIAEERFRCLKAPELMRALTMERNTSMGSPSRLPLRRSPPDLVYTLIDVTSGETRDRLSFPDLPR